MASVPDSIKFIRPLTLRIAEVEAKYPLVAYFCRMECVSRIIGAGAHTKDPEAAAYAEELMSKLEEFKAAVDPETLEILNSNEKSSEYMSTFSRSVVARAQKQMAQHQVTAGTGQTLLAAATFLEVCGQWADETESIKFCKYHAARILKEVREKRDPNLLYPKQELDEEQGDEELEKELEALVKSSEGSGDAATSALNSEKEVQKSPQPQPFEQDEPEAGPKAEPEAELKAEKSRTSTEAAPTLPSAPKDTPDIAPQSPPSTDLPATPAAPPGHKLPATPSAQPNDFGLPEAPGSQPVIFDYEEAAPKAPTIKQFTPAPAPAPVKTKAPSLRSVMSEAETTGKAQKHARYAVSALNYDDYKTAIAELEAALALLKASEADKS